MERENRLLLIFTLLIVIGAIFALVWIKTHSNYPQVVESSDKTALSAAGKFEEVPMLTDEKLAATDVNKRLSYEVHFPKVAYVTHEDLAKQANAVIATYVNDRIAEFKKNVDDLYSPDVPKDFESELSMRWSAALVSPTIVSLRFDYSEYIAGSAHPNSQTRVINYDLKNQMLLQTAALFASSTQALPFLSTYTREALRNILTEETPDMFRSQTLPGTEPTHDNFEEVAITKNGLLVIFNPYQVAPYARGTIEVAIPLRDLSLALIPDVTSAIDKASTNIVEATPESATGTPQKMEY